MMTRTLPRIFLFGILTVVLPLTLSAQREETDKRQEPETEKKGKRSDKEEAFTRLHIAVSGGEKPEPVENASIYVRYVEERTLGRDRKIEMNVKTNREGRASVARVPRGKVLVQVIATGWKTFGQWYDLEKDEETIKIRLQKPPRWY